MSYSIELSDEVKRKINGWNLSAHVIREILKGLDQVAGDPRRRLIRVGPPEDDLQFDVVVREPGGRPGDYLFVFSVLFGTDEETLHVIGCNFLFEARSH